MRLRNQFLTIFTVKKNLLAIAATVDKINVNVPNKLMDIQYSFTVLLSFFFLFFFKAF
jgi:hypothetical protein